MQQSWPSGWTETLQGLLLARIDTPATARPWDPRGPEDSLPGVTRQAWDSWEGAQGVQAAQRDKSRAPPGGRREKLAAPRRPPGGTIRHLRGGAGPRLSPLVDSAPKVWAGRPRGLAPGPGDGVAAVSPPGSGAGGPGKAFLGVGGLPACAGRGA